MKQEKWHNGQIALTNDLNRSQSTKEDAIRERFDDLHSRGIIEGALSEFAITAHPASTDLIDVAAGIGYTIGGERIYLNDSAAYNETNLTLTSTNGLGGFVATPKSTGSKGILLESGKYNYVFIRHIDATDTATVTATDVPGEIVYPKVDDGYAIKIVKQTAPYVVDAYTLLADPENYIYIGYVDYVTGGTIGSDRIYGTIDNKYPVERLKVIDEAIRTDVSPVAVASRDAYTNGSDVTFDAHVNAVGTGTITNVNPHGLTLQDLDILLKSTENHEKFIHAAAINAPGSSAATTSALYGNINAKGLVPLPDTDDLVIEGLTTNESAIQNGLTVSSSNVPHRYFIFFRDSTTGSTHLPDGTYTAYLDVSTKMFGLASAAGVGYQFYVQIKDHALPTPNNIGGYSGIVQNVAILTDANVMPLWQVDFTTSGTYLGGRVVSNIAPPPPSGVSNFNNRVDLRYFGSIGAEQLLRDAQTNTVAINHNISALNAELQNVDASGTLNVDGNVTTGGNVDVAGEIYLRTGVYSKRVAAVSILTSRGFNSGSTIVLTVPANSAPAFINVQASCKLRAYAPAETDVYLGRDIVMSAQTGYPSINLGQLFSSAFGYDNEGNQAGLSCGSTPTVVSALIAGVDYDPTLPVTVTLGGLYGTATVWSDENHRLTLMFG